MLARFPLGLLCLTLRLLTFFATLLGLSLKDRKVCSAHRFRPVAEVVPVLREEDVVLEDVVVPVLVERGFTTAVEKALSLCRAECIAVAMFSET